MPQRGSRDGGPLPPSASIWSQSHEPPQYGPLQEECRVDTVVIGGGVTGLSLAVRLARAGQAVAVVERRRLGSGTTGGSTAHLTAALDVPWSTIVGRFGESSARVVADSVRNAMAWIEEECLASSAAATLATVPGFRLATDEESAETLDREADVARRLGIDVRRAAAPAPFEATPALRFDDQAEIDPVAYVHGLARTFVGLGGRVFEHSPVVETSNDGICVAEGQTVRADAVVHATHTPSGLFPALQLRVAAFASYVLTARLGAPLDPALFWDCEDPYHYVRSLAPDRRLVLIGGEDHHVGRCNDPAARLRNLEQWARERFGALEVVGHWSAELFEPPDGLPFIGRSPGSRQLVATGFAGTGITFGSVAAELLADLLLGRDNPGERVFSPSRIGPFAGLTRTGREAASATWRFLADHVHAVLARGAGAELPRDCGRIVWRGRQPVALYRDPSGELHALSARCTHMGCIVQWNDLEKTWDCPCHGGRYHRTGKVIYGPPVRDLAHRDEL